MHFSILKWQPRWPPGFFLGWCNRMKSLAFSFSERECDVFLRLWCHYMGIPCQNWGNPLKIMIFGRFRLIMCIQITKLNVTIPVLLKKFRLKPLPTPFSHHPPHPIIAPPPSHTPLAPPPSHTPLALPPCPFLQPFPLTILPPPPKANWQLKIVRSNYFTCIQHFFCRW